MKKGFHIVLLTLILIALVTVDAEAQCAMCKAVIESESNPDEVMVSGGINKGILFLMGIPYLLLGAAGYYFYRSNRKQLS